MARTAVICQHFQVPRTPRAVLIDFGGTLVEEVAFDTRAGIDLLLAVAEVPPDAGVTATVIDRADRVTRDVGDQRDRSQIETPWASLTRLIHYPCGIRFTRPLAELEIPYWDACAEMRPMPGAHDALRELQHLGVPLALVSNSSFSASVLQHELRKHDLAAPLSAVIASAEYGVRKPNPLLFESRTLLFIRIRRNAATGGANVRILRLVSIAL